MFNLALKGWSSLAANNWFARKIDTKDRDHIQEVVLLSNTSVRLLEMRVAIPYIWCVKQRTQTMFWPQKAVFSAFEL